MQKSPEQMKKITVINFQDFLNEDYNPQQEFLKFYMLVKKPYPLDSEHLLSRLIGTARQALFQQVTLDSSNCEVVSLQPNIPVLNFTEDNDLVLRLLNDGGVEEKSLYNSPVQSSLVSDKVAFHKTFSVWDFVPKTVFSVEDSRDLKFPVIAKPSQGKSAEGIKKFETFEDLCSSPEKFDVFSEMVDIEKEFRCFCFKDQIIELDERVKVDDAEDFLKDTSTKTDFYYKKIDPLLYEYRPQLMTLLEKCRSVVSLDFFSVDFAETSDGKLVLIEMNSRTGMGVDKMASLYTLLHNDYYGKPPAEASLKMMNKLVTGWHKAYDENKGSLVNECTAVAGVLDGVTFLFKNRDRSYTPDTKIVREKVNGVEIVYYTDQTGWIEGMNEHGLGFVFTQLTTKEWKGYGPSYTVSDEPKNDSLFRKFAPKIKEMLSSESSKDAIKSLLDSGKSGSFLIGDKHGIYEVEIVDGKHKQRKLSFAEQPYYAKTNHGELFSGAGHQPSGESIKRASTVVRRHQAMMQLKGVQDVYDVPVRMKFQAFDPMSSLNVFRTDPEEYTISQCMMDLTNLKFYFFHDKTTADSLEVEDKVKNPKITVDCREI